MRIRFENNHEWRFVFDLINFVSPFILWLFSWGLVEDIAEAKIGAWGISIFPLSLIVHAKWMFPFYEQASSFCFTRFTLKIPISFRETKFTVNFTENNFSPGSLMYIASLPVKERKSELFKHITEKM